MENVTMQLIMLLAFIIYSPIIIAMALENKSPEEIREKKMRHNKRIETIKNFIDDIRYLIFIIIYFICVFYSHYKNKKLRPTWTKAGYYI